MIKDQIEKTKEIRDMIEEEYQNPDKMNVDYFVEYSGIGRTTMMNLFKDLFDMSIREYIEYTRMNKAVILLSETFLSGEEISKMVGYRNYQTFSNAFSKTFASTPIEYRKRHPGGCLMD